MSKGQAIGTLIVAGVMFFVIVMIGSSFFLGSTSAYGAASVNTVNYCDSQHGKLLRGLYSEVTNVCLVRTCNVDAGVCIVKWIDSRSGELIAEDAELFNVFENNVGGSS